MIETGKTANAREGIVVPAYEERRPSPQPCRAPTLRHRDIHGHRMPYCHADIPADEARELPALDDNTAWARLEMLHDHGCQWIATRGLQIT